MTDRETILSRLPRKGSEPPPARTGLRPLVTTDLWSVFAENLAALGGRMATLEEALDAASKRAWVDGDVPPPFAASEERIWEAEVGVTTAVCALADTGSIVLCAGPGRARLASLAPPLHIALIPEDAIYPSLDDALPNLPRRTTVLVTGTSRTADIEGALVRGVHGPREVWVVRV